MSYQRVHLTPCALLVLCLSLCLQQVTAASTFAPNCTLPSEGTNFVSGPNTRGTLSILWNCLSIILLCTWTIQHLNIPAQRPILGDHTSWWKGTCKTLWWKILDTGKQVKWMLLTVLIPEYIMGKAWGDRQAAVAVRDLFRSRNLIEGAELVHGYFANMGGYYLDFSHIDGQMHMVATLSPEAEHVKLGSRPPKADEVGGHCDERNLNVHDVGDVKIPLYSTYGTEYGDKSCLINLAALQRPQWSLNGWQLHELHQQHILEHLPILSARDIEALDDSSAFVKLLAILQLRGLPSSQLEIAALAFAASSFFTYLILWGRPRNITRRFKVLALREPTEKGVVNLIRYGPTFLLHRGRREDVIDHEYHVVPIPNDAIHSAEWGADFKSGPPLIFGSIFGGVVFGGLHCLAWNSQFPTPTEALAWRICAVVTTIVPIIATIPMFLFEVDSPLTKTAQRRLAAGIIAVIFLLIPYILARLFLLVEMFRSLLYLPPAAFKETWSGWSLPHLG
ncbi:hypothetical protein EG328_008447 [Venturia inaequalis]|uniref:Uncharacterized protein n=2 Tax=Venturia inaequalis TaxID=5025 RepID=A0A8H3VBF2_VENIN|nr:hypothetical protein EG328_008447 [Venturia inaequalis]